MGSFISILLAPLLSLFAGGEGDDDAGALPLSELLEQLMDHQQQQQEQPVDVQWDLICRRLRGHPEEAAAYCHTVDPSPLLQCLVNTPTSLEIPVAVIRAFLEAYEDAVFSSDQYGVTPLLAAVRRAAVVPSPEVDIIPVLLQANSFAAQQTDQQGRLPLHYVRNDLDTAQRVLNAYPSGVMQKDSTGKTPLHYFCQLTMELSYSNSDDSRREQLNLPNADIARLLLLAATAKSMTASPVLTADKKGQTPLQVLYESMTTSLQGNSKNPKAIDALWDILTLFVRSACPNPHSTPLLHSLVSLHCPAPIIREALHRFPQQAIERDNQGRTPLLLAVDLMDNKDVVCELLQANRRAARMTDREGRLAIDVLSENPSGYSEELYDLMVQAEPRALCTRDLKNKQHPFLTAAMAGNSNGVYHLLRAKPHVIRYFLNEC